MTVEVATVKKGKCRPGETLVARGSSIRLKRGYAGGTGHYGDGTFDPLIEVRPGRELLLYLGEPKNSAHPILFPNGFAVIAKAAAMEDEPWPWAWVVGGLVFLGTIVFVSAWGIRNYLMRKGSGGEFPFLIELD